MANSAQATKRARQADRRRMRNVVQRTRFRTFQKRAVVAIDSKDATKAKEAVNTFVQVADIAASKGIVHRNKAARIKSRLNIALLRLSAS